MFSKTLKSNTFLILLCLTLIGGILRFSNLNWGAPYYFHPDERNIASSVSQLSFPKQMNPNFFAYGSLPIYTIYFTGTFINSLSHLPSLPADLSLEASAKWEALAKEGPTFAQSIIISRFYSALFATLLIPLIYLIAKNLRATFTHNHDDEHITGLIAATLATFSVGFIQFAHFGTFEMWLTFFTLILFWICFKAVTNQHASLALLLGIVFAILLSTKVSNLALLPLPVFILLLHTPKKPHWKHLSLQIAKNLRNFIIFFIPVCVIYIATNPFAFLDTTSFFNSMKYESSVGLGTEIVFYTGEFFGKIPVVFQFLHIYPFLINPLLTVIFIVSFVYLTYLAIKTRNSKYALLNIFFLITFLSQAILFAKWTRYMMPTLPFIYLIIALALSLAFHHFLKGKLSMEIKISAGIVLGISVIFALSYFITAFIQPDTRLQAKQFADKSIPPDAAILSEVYDLGITPFNNNYPNITLFNFYDLDNNSPDSNNQTLQVKLQQVDYIILPSQRILKPRLENKQQFSNGNQFYTQLINGTLGFKKIYETPCDIFCKITYLGSPVFSFEETANVFDRPTVFVFKRI